MTKSGKARVKQSTIKYLQELSVLMEDSMVSSLIINHSGDYIKIIGYKGMSNELFSFAFTDSLIFGTNSEATVSLPKSGQSISCHPYPYFRYYRLYDSPTPGQQNVESDIVGILNGKTFDQNKNVIKINPFIYLKT